MDEFHAGQPIFVQIRQRLMDMILRGSVADGDALPSIRQVATELSVNPLTVTRAFEALVDIGAVEKRRGLGMYVTTGGRDALLQHERSRFLSEDWPRISRGPCLVPVRWVTPPSKGTPMTPISTAARSSV